MEGLELMDGGERGDNSSSEEESMKMCAVDTEEEDEDEDENGPCLLVLASCSPTELHC